MKRSHYNEHLRLTTEFERIIEKTKEEGEPVFETRMIGEVIIPEELRETPQVEYETPMPSDYEIPVENNYETVPETEPEQKPVWEGYKNNVNREHEPTIKSIPQKVGENPIKENNLEAKIEAKEITEFPEEVIEIKDETPIDAEDVIDETIEDIADHTTELETEIDSDLNLDYDLGLDQDYDLEYDADYDL